MKKEKKCKNCTIEFCNKIYRILLLRNIYIYMYVKKVQYNVLTNSIRKIYIMHKTLNCV